MTPPTNTCLHRKTPRHSGGASRKSATVMLSADAESRKRQRHSRSHNSNVPLERSSGTFSSPLSFRPVGTDTKLWMRSAGDRLGTASVLSVIQYPKACWESVRAVSAEIPLTSHPTAPWRAASDAADRHLYRSRTDWTERRRLSRESTSCHLMSLISIPSATEDFPCWQRCLWTAFQRGWRAPGMTHNDFSQ